jgi:hypothetical protein
MAWYYFVLVGIGSIMLYSMIASIFKTLVANRLTGDYELKFFLTCFWPFIILYFAIVHLPIVAGDTAVGWAQSWSRARKEAKRMREVEKHRRAEEMKRWKEVG